MPRLAGTVPPGAARPSPVPPQFRSLLPPDPARPASFWSAAISFFLPLFPDPGSTQSGGIWQSGLDLCLAHANLDHVVLRLQATESCEEVHQVLVCDPTPFLLPHTLGALEGSLFSCWRARPVSSASEGPVSIPLRTRGTYCVWRSWTWL